MILTTTQNETRAVSRRNILFFKTLYIMYVCTDAVIFVIFLCRTIRQSQIVERHLFHSFFVLLHPQTQPKLNECWKLKSKEGKKHITMHFLVLYAARVPPFGWEGVKFIFVIHFHTTSSHLCAVFSVIQNCAFLQLAHPSLNLSAKPKQTEWLNFPKAENISWNENI